MVKSADWKSVGVFTGLWFDSTCLRQLTLTLPLLFLMGCGVDNSGVCTIEHTLTEEVTDVYGVTVMPGERMFATPTEITQYYEDIQACIGLSTEGPQIYYKPFSEYFNGVINTWGFYHPGGVIYINTDNPVPGVERDCETDRQVLRHEFVHHILGTYDMDEAYHASPFFEKCQMGVDVRN